MATPSTRSPSIAADDDDDNDDNDDDAVTTMPQNIAAIYQNKTATAAQVAGKVNYCRVEVDLKKDNDTFVNAYDNVWWSKENFETNHPGISRHAESLRSDLNEFLDRTFRKIADSRRKKSMLGILRINDLVVDLVDIRNRLDVRMTGRACENDRMITLSPHVWIRCDDESSIRKLKKKLAKHPDANKVPETEVFLILDPPRLADEPPEHLIKDLNWSGGIVLPNGDRLHIHLEKSVDSRAVCGLICCSTITRNGGICDQRLSRIGGLLRLNGYLDVATTAAHGMLSYILSQLPARSDGLTPSDSSVSLVAPETESSSEDESYDSEDSPMQFPTSQPSACLGEVSVPVSWEWTTTRPINTSSFIVQLREPGTYGNQWHLEDSGTMFATDYALIKPPSSHFASNESGFWANGLWIGVGQASYSENWLGNAQIILRHNLAVDVSILEEEVPIRIHGIKLVTRKLVLPRPLGMSPRFLPMLLPRLLRWTLTTSAPGTSGSWVVRHGLFCGMIVALFSREPFALMLSAQTLLNDMKRYGSNIQDVIVKPLDQSSLQPGMLLAHHGFR